MEVSAPTTPVKPLTLDAVWRLTVAQYHQMLASGILTDGDPIELLEGWLIIKMTKNRPHQLATELTRQMLSQILPPGWSVESQGPITTADSEPEPDVMVVRGTQRDYVAEHPSPPNVALVVEVADSSLTNDRTLKARLYARAAIPLYWIVNLVDKTLEVYQDPAGDDHPAYRHRQVYTLNDHAPVTIDGTLIATVAVKSLFA